MSLARSPQLYILISYTTPPVADSDSHTMYSKVSWDTCSFISRLDVLSILIKNFHETLLK